MQVPPNPYGKRGHFGFRKIQKKGSGAFVGTQKKKKKLKKKKKKEKKTGKFLSGTENMKFWILVFFSFFFFLFSLGGFLVVSGGFHCR